MPLFHRVKTEKGFKMVEVPVVDIEPVELEQPTSATLPGGKAVYTCLLCPKPREYRSAGMAALHVQKQHKEIERPDWRKAMTIRGTDR